MNKFNKNGTGILQSCVLDASCQKANGCSAICGKIPGDSQVVTFKSDLDWNQNRRLRITAYNVLNPEVEVDLEVIKYGNGLQMSCDKYSNGVRMSCGGQTCFKSDFTKLDGLALLGISFALAVICGRCLNTRP